MKVHLERTLPTCPDTLRCKVCNHGFTVGRIRTLLIKDDGLIQGDICPNCLKSGSSAIRHRLKEQASQWMQQEVNGRTSIAQYKLALEQMETAEEDIQLPWFYHWWLKRLAILSQETQELETARLGLSGCQCGKPRSRLRITFQDEE